LKNSVLRSTHANPALDIAVLKIAMLFSVAGIEPYRVDLDVAQTRSPVSKTLTAPLTFVFFASASFLEEFDKEPVASQGHVLCPVCHMEVDPAAAPKSAYKGKTYNFMGEDHKKLFDTDPEKYSNALLLAEAAGRRSIRLVFPQKHSQKSSDIR
jgi:YHS domain-containing protein